MVLKYLYPMYLLVTLLALCANAAPTSNPSALYKRQNAPFDGPKVIQTHHVIPVPGGSVVEDCTITLTPIVVNGRNLVREERRCSDLFVPTGQTLPPPPTGSNSGSAGTGTPTPPPPTETTTTTTTTTINSASDSASDSASASVTVSASDSISNPPATVSDSASISATDSGVPVPTISDPSSASNTGVDPVPPSASDDPVTASPSNTDPVVVLGPTNVPVGSNPTTSAPQNQSADPSGTRANDGAPTQSQTNVAIPGKKLEVLPIGLGVFAGISVIALIVVGLVTYERTKYRKAFRQRRLAASGAEMGYGGMSERQ